MARELTRRQFLQAAAGLVGAAFVAGCEANSPGQPAYAVARPAAVTPTPAPVHPHPAPAHRARRRTRRPGGAGPLCLVDRCRQPSPFQVSTTGPGGAVLISLIYDTLTWKDQHGHHPLAGAGWESAPDGLSVTFRLRRERPLAGWAAPDRRRREVLLRLLRQAPLPLDADTDGGWGRRAGAATGAAAAQAALRRLPGGHRRDRADHSAHVWEAVADPVKYSGADAALGSGPLRLMGRDEAAGAYRLAANPAYWRGRVPRGRVAAVQRARRGPRRDGPPGRRRRLAEQRRLGARAAGERRPPEDPRDRAPLDCPAGRSTRRARRWTARRSARRWPTRSTAPASPRR